MVKDDNKYLPEIEDNAQKFGYKSANLLHLESKIHDFITENCQILDDAGIKVQVPAFKPIEGSIIEQHLDKHQPNWRELFDNFKQAYQAQDNKEILGSDTEGCLKKLQQSIIECFNEHDIEPSLFEQFLRENQLQADDLLMIRSTGIKEDKADMANPGGNESLPCKVDIHQISQAIGQVAASYVGQKSLSQRLALNDQTITELPVMPVLIQKMIGQGLVDGNQSADLEQTVPVSGVMHSQDGATRLQVAPGHGEYVVNSKGLADNIYITPQSTIYREVAPKEFRLQATWNEADKKIDLQRQSNPAELKYQPSIDNKVAYSLHRLAQYVEQQYGKRMDIEFVYDPATKIINIVQARAIPQSKKRGLEPSAISLTYLANPDNNITTIKGLQVITPEINAVALITDHSQMIICDTISQALTQFNQASNKENIKGIIVKQPAPDASHEAGFFNSQNLAVMQVADLEQVEQLFKENQHLLIDPQHSNIYQLPKERFTELAQQSNNIEQSLYDQGIIAKGIWASTLSGYVTVNDYSFPEQIQLSQQPVGALSEKSIGQLVQEANNGNIESTNQLLSRAYQALAFKIPGQEPLGQTAAEGDKAQILRDNLTKLSSPMIAEKNDQLRALLGYSLTAMVDARKKGKVTAELFKQIMISGAELSASLDTLQALPRDCDEQSKNKAYLQYFNVQKKFTGLMLATGGKNITVDSLASHSKQAQAREEMDQLINQLPASTKSKVTQNQKDYLLESLKLGDYLLNEDSKKRWQKFCLDICTNLDHNDKPDIVSAAAALGKLVNKLVSLGVHQQWVNLIFTQEKNLDKPIDALKKFYEQLNNIDLTHIIESNILIGSLQAQIDQWSQPEKFDKLFTEFQQNLQKLNNDLQWNKEADNLQKILVLEQVNQLTEVIDKSIKSLERSSLYPQEQQSLQVQRFLQMVEQFYGVMEIWVKRAEFPTTITEISVIQYLENLKNQIESKRSQSNLTINEFRPSDRFTVNAATVDITGTRLSPVSSEDIFTLVHQNVIVATSKLAIDVNQVILGQCPELVQKLNEQLDNKLIQPPIIGNRSDQSIKPATAINMQDGVVMIEKNIPLRYHSAMVKIFYNTLTKESSLEFCVLGDIVPANRMANIKVDSYIKLTVKGYQFKQEPTCLTLNGRTGLMKFRVIIKDQQPVEDIVDEINKAISTTYLHDFPYQIIDKKKRLMDHRLALLSQANEDQLVKMGPKIYRMLLDPNSFGQITVDNNNAPIIEMLLEQASFSELTTTILRPSYLSLDHNLSLLFLKKISQLIDYASLPELITIIFDNTLSLDHSLSQLCLKEIKLRDHNSFKTKEWLASWFSSRKNEKNGPETYIRSLFKLITDDIGKNILVDILDNTNYLLEQLNNDQKFLFVKQLCTIEDKKLLLSTLNKVLAHDDSSWLEELDSYNLYILASKIKGSEFQGKVPQALQNIDLRNESYNDFRNMLVKKIEELLSTNLQQKCYMYDTILTEYNNGIWTLNKLTATTNGTMQVMFDNSNIVKQGYCSMDDLSQLTFRTRGNIMNPGHFKNLLTLCQLLKEDEQLPKAVISTLKLNLQKRSSLLSDKALELYMAGDSVYEMFSKLQKFDANKILVLTSDAKMLYDLVSDKKEPVSEVFNQLCTLEPKEIETLTSYPALNVYKELQSKQGGSITEIFNNFASLAKDNKEILDKLISESALKEYQSGVTFQQYLEKVQPKPPSIGDLAATARNIGAVAVPHVASDNYITDPNKTRQALQDQKNTPSTSGGRGV